MRSVEERAGDVRLAWLIVGAGALVTAVIVALVGAMLWRQAERQVADGMEQARATAARQREALATIRRAPPPPDTAAPIGDVGRWVGPDDYPAAAIRAGEEGRVRVTLAIGADGRPTGCSVARSSGSWSLDNGTCLTMMRRGRFGRAGRNEVGSRPGEVRRWTSPLVRWVLPR